MHEGVAADHERKPGGPGSRSPWLAVPGLLDRAGLLICLALAACGDGPTGPDVRVPTSLRIDAGDAQTATLGLMVPVAPAVVVLDQTGAPMAGVTVRFTVVEGGGAVQPATALTDAQGRASPGSWTLGPAPGTNVLEIAVDGVQPVRVNATAESPFHIDVRYVANATASQRAAVEAAVSRWRSVIIRDLAGIPLTVPAQSCFAAQPALSELIDDLVVFIEFTSIDGPGDVLGKSGPCYIRTSNDLPILGYMQLDVADLAQADAAGLLTDLVLHEIGHVLGFGTIWSELGLITGVGSADPRFVGSTAVAAFHAAGGSDAAVPVENEGSDGTRDSHWRETVLGNEVMTGFIDNGGNPLSAITIGSLQDLGYGTSTVAASPFTIASAGLRTQAAPSGMDLRGREVIRRPTHRIGPLGERTPIPR